MDRDVRQADGFAYDDVSASGSFVYVPSDDALRSLRSSSWIPVTVEWPKSDVWAYDVGRRDVEPPTAEGNFRTPACSPDGKHVAFASNRTVTWRFFQTPADGSGPA